jgi:hypothetical protein
VRDESSLCGFQTLPSGFRQQLPLQLQSAPPAARLLIRERLLILCCRQHRGTFGQFTVKSTAVECATPPASPVMIRLNFPREVFPFVDTNKVEVLAWLPKVTLAGEKLQATPLGSPEQESAMVEVKLPPIGLRATVKFPDCPCFTVAEEGVALMEKSAPMPLRLTVASAKVIPSEPLAVSAPKRVPRATGLNLMLNTQELPARRPSAEQVLLWEKSPAMPTLENWKQVPPVLLNATDCGALDVPGTWLGKLSALVEKLTFAVRATSYAPKSTVLRQSLLPSSMRGLPPKSVCGKFGALLVPASIPGELFCKWRSPTAALTNRGSADIFPFWPPELAQVP